MNNIELNRKPEAAPPLWAQVVSGIVVATTLYLLIIVLFSL